MQLTRQNVAETKSPSNHRDRPTYGWSQGWRRTSTRRGAAHLLPSGSSGHGGVLWAEHPHGWSKGQIVTNQPHNTASFDLTRRPASASDQKLKPGFCEAMQHAWKAPHFEHSEKYTIAPGRRERVSPSKNAADFLRYTIFRWNGWVRFRTSERVGMPSSIEAVPGRSPLQRGRHDAS
jgi:hypothetical protein